MNQNNNEDVHAPETSTTHETPRAQHTQTMNTELQQLADQEVIDGRELFAVANRLRERRYDDSLTTEEHEFLAEFSELRPAARHGKLINRDNWIDFLKREAEQQHGVDLTQWPFTSIDWPKAAFGRPSQLVWLLGGRRYVYHAEGA